MKKTIKRIWGLFLVACMTASFVTASASANECYDTDGGVVSSYAEIKASSLGYLPGDINDDDGINAKDAVLLAQYLANWDVEINTDAADVNSDLQINAVDAVRLAQYLANWDVVLRGVETGDVEIDPDDIFGN